MFERKRERVSSRDVVIVMLGLMFVVEEWFEKVVIVNFNRQQGE